MNPALLLLAALAASAHASALSELAASLAPGQWGVLKPSGASTIGGGLITSYGDSASWDPVRRRLHFVGSDHQFPYDHAVWDEASNAWIEGASFPGIPFSTLFVGHAFDGNAADPVTGDVYYRLRDDTPGAAGVDIFRFSAAAGSWTPAADNPLETDEGGLPAQGIAYFPELDGGSLVWIVNSGQVYRCQSPCAAPGAWSKLADLGEAFGTWGFAEYNAVRKVVLFGSGATGRLYKLSSSGAVTRLADLPAAIYDGGGFNGHVAADPVTGTFIVLTAGASKACRTFDVDTGVWGSCPAPPAALAGSSAAAAIAAHGVIAFMACGTASWTCRGELVVYKHAASPSPDRLPPAKPARLVLR